MYFINKMVKISLIVSLISTTLAKGFKHPIVQANANQIHLNLRGTDDYYGPLFIGSEYREIEMVYDTASQWITVNTETTANAELISNYDIDESTTAQVIYQDAE